MKLEVQRFRFVYIYIYGLSYVLFGYAVGAVVAPGVHTQLHVPEDCLPIR